VPFEKAVQIRREYTISKEQLCYRSNFNDQIDLSIAKKDMT
jgi:hypothetical protein